MGLERIFTEPTPIPSHRRRIVKIVMWSGWLVTALLVVVFWAVVIAATLALFPALRRGHHSQDDHE